jgi:hypothetical protein
MICHSRLAVARNGILISLVFILCGSTGRVHALATEQIGNAPIMGWNFTPQVLAAVNQPTRVYWYEVNGNPFFYFRGNSQALNHTIRRFTAITCRATRNHSLGRPRRN